MAGIKEQKWFDLPNNLLKKFKSISKTEQASFTEVPGSFADLTEVQSYLSTVIPEIETKLNEIVSNLKE
mgnify:FL=1